jgi:ribosomal protein S1
VPAGLNDGDEPGQDSVLHRGVVAPGALTTWLAAVGNHRGARAAIYSLFERSHQLNGIDEAEYRKLEQCVGRNCAGRVTENNDNGLELKLTEPSEVSAWMRAEEFSWYCDETHDQVTVGQTMAVVGLEVDLAGGKVLVSCRPLTHNPYAQYRPGQRVTCIVTKKYPLGAELNIDRLCGWIFDDQLVVLPQEGLLRSGSQPFDAIVVDVDSEGRGKLTVSRRPIVQSLIRSIASATPLIGMVTKIKDKGAELMLAPDLKAWLPGGEVSWQKGVEIRRYVQENQEIAVVLLPEQVDKSGDLSVSRKRVHSSVYSVTGEPGRFFGKKWANVNQILENFRSEGKAVNVDDLKGGSSGAQILIGADDAPTFNALVRALSSMASANRCSLRPMGQGRHAPTRVENLLLPGHQKSIPPTSAQSAQDVPQRQRSGHPPKIQRPVQSAHDVQQPQSLIGKIWAIVRELFR